MTVTDLEAHDRKNVRTLSDFLAYWFAYNNQGYPRGIELAKELGIDLHAPLARVTQKGPR